MSSYVQEILRFPGMNCFSLRCCIERNHCLVEWFERVIAVCNGRERRLNQETIL